MKYVIALLMSMWFTQIQAAGTIILLVDTSSSMTRPELNHQLTNYSKAMREIIHLRGVNIEVVLFDNDPAHISSGSWKNAADAFDRVERTRAEFRGLTCMVTALNYVETLIHSVPQPVVLDISGDGEANCDNSPQLHDVLDRIASKGVQINTLLVNAPKPPYDNQSPQAAYEAITRNNGFMIEAYSFYDFEEALFEKLILEVAELLP